MSHFNGPDYVPEWDHTRLVGQIRRIYNVMSDGVWRTVDEIADITGDPHNSVQAQLRHLRKERFGKHNVPKRRRGAVTTGLFEWRLEVREMASAKP